MSGRPRSYRGSSPSTADRCGNVEVYNDNGSTQAVVYPTPTAKRKQTFMLFAYPTGVQGNAVSAGVNEFIIPNYKQTWGGIRKIADAPEGVRHLTYKSEEYSAG